MTARFWGDLKSSDFAALPRETTVAVLTGNGLKATDRIAELLGV